MPPILLFEHRHLWGLCVAGDDLFFEVSSLDGPATLFRMRPGEPAHEIGRLPLGRPRGVLQTIQDGQAICLEADGTLVALGIPGGRRTVLRKLSTDTVSVGVTPEAVVWGTRDTRDMTGDGPELAGELWRWWRGTETCEYLGEHRSSNPELVVACSPIRADAIGSDVFVAADQQLGVVDTNGLRWLEHEEQLVNHATCTADALYYSTHSQAIRRDAVTGERRMVWRSTIPMALAATEGRLVVARNAVSAGGGRLSEDSAIIIVDLATGAGSVVASGFGRPSALALDSCGIYVTTDDWLEERLARLMFVPWDEPPLEEIAGRSLERALWEHPVGVHWWRPEGDGGTFMLDRHGRWHLLGPTQSTGTLAEAARIATLLGFERWLAEWRFAANGWIDPSQPGSRGWIVSWGMEGWHCVARDHSSEAARAIAAFLALASNACPALADVMRSMP